MKDQNRVVGQSMRQLTPAETEVVNGGFVVNPSTPSKPQPFITCMPGLVFRCNKFGCFCLPPN
jgi:hypothetical protein